MREDVVGLIDCHGTISIQIMDVELRSDLFCSHVREHVDLCNSVDPCSTLDLCQFCVHIVFVKLGPEALELGWLVEVRICDWLLVTIFWAEEVSVTNVVPAGLVMSQFTILVLVDFREESFQLFLSLDDQYCLDLRVIDVDSVDSYFRILLLFLIRIAFMST